MSQKEEQDKNVFSEGLCCRICTLRVFHLKLLDSQLRQTCEARDSRRNSRVRETQDNFCNWASNGRTFLLHWDVLRTLVKRSWTWLRVRCMYAWRKEKEWKVESIFFEAKSLTVITLDSSITSSCSQKLLKESFCKTCLNFRERENQCRMKKTRAFSCESSLGRQEHVWSYKPKCLTQCLLVRVKSVLQVWIPCFMSSLWLWSRDFEKNVLQVACLSRCLIHLLCLIRVGMPQECLSQDERGVSHNRQNFQSHTLHRFPPN